MRRALKNKWHFNGSARELQCPFFSLRCRTSGYKNLMLTAPHRNVIRTVQITKNYEEEIAKWESWLKRIGLTCPKETENLKTPSFVYILYVAEQSCTQDTHHLPVNQRPLMAGQQRKSGWRGLRHYHAKQHVLHLGPYCSFLINRKSGVWSWKGMFQRH